MRFLQSGVITTGLIENTYFNLVWSCRTDAVSCQQSPGGDLHGGTRDELHMGSEVKTIYSVQSLFIKFFSFCL